PGEVRLTLTRRVGVTPGHWTTEDANRALSVKPGGAFRFAGLAPCPYELVVEGDGVAAQTLDLDVYADVAGVEIHAKRATPPVAATVVGKLTLGFDGKPRDCGVAVEVGDVGDSADVKSDGSFAIGGLVAGKGWASIDYT